eukprot:TRINITY_DN19979_c0_g1_i1.p1 TRINITY_DN19979_c0_g1~~TRINITY_DN19979_c0_g1_i1.p1  ORF type:complete len:292 (-),score=98.79 TRINITY_DN19979_c0_g1_i1:119-994(-)
MSPGHLGLRLLPPKSATGGSAAASLALPLSSPPDATGEELKKQILEALQAAGHELPQRPEGEEHEIFVQNASRNANRKFLDLAKGLAEQGIEEEAFVSVFDPQRDVRPQESALRQNIAKNGGQSYYFAHANEKELPPELRYVYGGEPIKLDGGQAANASPASNGGYAAGDASSSPGATDIAKDIPVKAIQKYSWADEGDFVCVYVGAEGEADAIAAAKDGKNDEVQVNFEARAAELRITSGPKVFALLLRELEKEIVPEESKMRVSAGKRITLKLKKKRGVLWTRLVQPRT